MKTKTLMTMAVASTIGLSAAAFAGSGHEVITPFSVSEAGENIFTYKKGFSGQQQQLALGSTSHEASGWVSSSSSDSSSISSESTASLGMAESLALSDDGSYSDFYVVSFMPVIVESWDLYVIETGDMNELAAADASEIGMPTHELALISSDDGSTMELALVPMDELSSSEAVGD